MNLSVAGAVVPNYFWASSVPTLGGALIELRVRKGEGWAQNLCRYTSEKVVGLKWTRPAFWLQVVFGMIVFEICKSLLEK